VSWRNASRNPTSTAAVAVDLAADYADSASDGADATTLQPLRENSMARAPALGLAIAAWAVIAAAAPARATELCGWLVETTDAEAVHEFALWLEADGDLDFFYKMTGQGITTDSSRAYSPGSGTFSLHAGRPEKAWGFGSNIDGAGDVDIVAEIHTPPKSIFDEDDTPLLASFAFKRHVPEDEKTPPTEFAKRQCVTISPAQ
jgi:hypothetical protein